MLVQYCRREAEWRCSGIKAAKGDLVTLAPERIDSGDKRVPPAPEPGQIVKVRGSTWAVADVREQGLPRSPADEGAAHLTHVVSLQSLEEDRLGEELAVVWELEVAHTVEPDQGLPERVEEFDDPNTLAAYVDAVRWGAVTSADADSYQAPFRSGAKVEAYQLEPLRRALQSSRTNLLLADDVGLGKTIEAGLVIQELLLRHRARTVIIVCPPSLALKWQAEMRDKFGLDFVIVNSELLAATRRSHGLAANPFRLHPRVIVSMAWLPSLRAQRLLRSVYADAADTTLARRFAFDVLVVDEAHHIAPANPAAAGGRRGYAVDSHRTTATRALAERCEHRLFLSTTPHNGYSESFTALREMIDGRRFSRGAMLDEKALREVTVRRLKAELTEKNFQPRRISVIRSPRATTSRTGSRRAPSAGHEPDPRSRPPPLPGTRNDHRDEQHHARSPTDHAPAAARSPCTPNPGPDHGISPPDPTTTTSRAQRASCPTTQQDQMIRPAEPRPRRNLRI